MLTNGLGIVRHIPFLNDSDFKTSHPELTVEKKSDSPDEDKLIGDVSSLILFYVLLPLHNLRHLTKASTH